VEKTIVFVAGSGMWDSAFNTIIGGFKTVNGAMANLGFKASGAPMIIYTETNDTGFHFQAAVPVAQAPIVPENTGILVGKSPSGKALKFVHRGSYDDMDSIYDGTGCRGRRARTEGSPPHASPRLRYALANRGHARPIQALAIARSRPYTRRPRRTGSRTCGGRSASSRACQRNRGGPVRPRPSGVRMWTNVL
jgi:hypothetical protein